MGNFIIGIVLGAVFSPVLARLCKYLIRLCKFGWVKLEKSIDKLEEK